MMNKQHKISRRNFLQLSASFGMVAALGRFNLTQAAQAPDYKALVCVFMLGGNDGHNLVVPLGSPQYSAYQAARASLALPTSQLLPITDPTRGQFGLHYGLPELQGLYQQGRMAILANVGNLVRPTSYADFQAANQLPVQLRSHSDQVAQMQTGVPNASGSTGWGGRTVDLMQPMNAATSFPVSISMSGNALFCAGSVVQAAALQPGNDLDQSAMSLWPATATQARVQAQQQVVTQASGNQMIDAANKSMASALALNPLLKAASGNPPFTTQFPSTSLGNQLKEVARMIGLRSQLGVCRQVFFCSLGGFDTHGGQGYQQWDLLRQVSQAVAAFYDSTVQMGVSTNVTTFTLSDFGRTLQPSGSGSDHGWGNHHLVVGGAVSGGKIFGSFPLMTNYANFNSTHDDYADTRGVLLPGLGLSQYGATMAKWFGASDAQLDTLFPTLSSFALRDIGFLP
jgi:uncharacterized protein (DUF1501 family)